MPTALATAAGLMLLLAACTGSGSATPSPATGSPARPSAPIVSTPAATAPVAATQPAVAATQPAVAATQPASAAGATQAPVVDTPAPTQAQASPATGSQVVTPAPAATASAAAFTGGLIGPATELSFDEPRPAPPLSGLVRGDGTPFELTDLAGHPVLLFFGYTHCPDICPTTIGEMFSVLKADPEVRAVFVSIDPERDTAEFMARWTAYFPEGFVGLTGTPGSVRQVADRYGIKYARVETTSKGGYTMSHTADQYLIDGSGQLRAAYPFGTTSADILADIARLPGG